MTVMPRDTVIRYNVYGVRPQRNDAYRMFRNLYLLQVSTIAMLTGQYYVVRRMHDQVSGVCCCTRDNVYFQRFDSEEAAVFALEMGFEFTTDETV